ncbi:hypothetical protein [Achromobacter spanius]|uniref:hypothetical protein n=1 Tax=Achromobacter spanius TaxID=217203 RepID=UPI00380B103F
MELLQQCFVQVLVKAPRTNAEKLVVLRQGVCVPGVGGCGCVGGYGAVNVRLQVFPLCIFVGRIRRAGYGLGNHSGR